MTDLNAFMNTSSSTSFSQNISVIYTFIFQQQAEERARLLKEHLERRRKQGKDFEMERRHQLLKLEQFDRLYKLQYKDIREESKPTDSNSSDATPRPSEAPSISMVLAKLNEMPILEKINKSPEINQDMDTGGEDESSAMTEDDQTSNSSSVHSNVLHKCNAIRKKKDNILRRLNAKSTDSRGKWNKLPSNYKAGINLKHYLVQDKEVMKHSIKDQSIESTFLENLAKRTLETSGTSMELTNLPKDSELPLQYCHHESDSHRSQWLHPAHILIHKLGEETVLSGSSDNQTVVGSSDLNVTKSDLQNRLNGLGSPVKHAWQLELQVKETGAETKMTLPSTTTSTTTVTATTTTSSSSVMHSPSTPGPSGPGGPNVHLSPDCLHPINEKNPTSSAVVNSTALFNKRFPYNRMATYRLKHPRVISTPDDKLFEKVDFLDDPISDQSIPEHRKDRACELEDLENGQNSLQDKYTTDSYRQMIKSGSLPNISNLFPLSNDIELDEVGSVQDQYLLPRNSSSPSQDDHDHINLQDSQNPGIQQQNIQILETSFQNNNNNNTASPKVLNNADDDNVDDEEDIELVRQSMLKIILNTSTSAVSYTSSDEGGCSHNSMLTGFDEQIQHEANSSKRSSYNSGEDNHEEYSSREQYSVGKVNGIHSERIQRHKYSLNNTFYREDDLRDSRKRSLSINLPVQRIPGQHHSDET
ncbi:unnamed protein product [Heterobilharzia americana]|nr:unnamed protein product [Heterobilharzia americana]